MNWSNLLSRGGRLTARVNPFGRSTTDAVPRQQPELAVASSPAPVTPPPARTPRVRRSWFGWLFGNSRRHDHGRLVQAELLLQNVKPVRNDFRDESAQASRSRPMVLWETPVNQAPRDDQDHAWNRLRNRKPASLVVNAD